jgi:hypothetical protein
MQTNSRYDKCCATKKEVSVHMRRGDRGKTKRNRVGFLKTNKQTFRKVVKFRQYEERE